MDYVMQPWHVADGGSTKYSIRAVREYALRQILGDESRSLEGASPYGIRNAGIEAMAKLAPRRKKCTPEECTLRSRPAAARIDQLRTAAR